MPVSPSNSQPQPVLVGRSNCPDGTNCNNAGSFAIDELGLWERALTAEEIQALFLANPLIYGCTDQDACNFQEEANVDDGSCYSCNVPAAHCGPGTHWDETLSACVADVPSAETAEICTLMSLQELTEGYLNLLEIVAYQDSLLAAEQGNIDGNGNDGTSDDWACGDPVTYWDYDYATVLIGDQCWFAENLRSETYANGDSVPAGLTDGEWSTTTNGAISIFGEGGSECNAQSPNGDACDEIWSLEEYGRLYNWYAVDDNRGLCPYGWNVPADNDWMALEIELGMSESVATNTGWRGSDQGLKMKSASGWYNEGNGNNSSGFLGLPGDDRRDSGVFDYAGSSGHWWSSTHDGINAGHRSLNWNFQTVRRDFNDKHFGFSVRCIKD